MVYTVILIYGPKEIYGLRKPLEAADGLTSRANQPELALRDLKREFKV